MITAGKIPIPGRTPRPIESYDMKYLKRGLKSMIEAYEDSRLDKDGR